MRRLVVVSLACMLCAGAKGPHVFAGMSRASAMAQATAVARAFSPSILGYEDPAVFKNLALTDLQKSRDTRGRESWLAVFRYAGHRDAACVWVRATEGPWPYAYEESQSVAWGPTVRVHERCMRIAFRLRLLDPEKDEAGSEIPIPAYAYPTPVSPLGPVAHGSYLADLEDTDGGSLSGVPAKFPQTTAPGTSGLEGFVIDERTWRVIPGGTILVTPSTRLSGFWRVPPPGFRSMLEVTPDRLGAFAILTLPARKLGYDFVIRAPGYADAYVVHELSLPGVFIGDFTVARHRRFVDQAPGPPPCGASC